MVGAKELAGGVGHSTLSQWHSRPTVFHWVTGQKCYSFYVSWSNYKRRWGNQEFYLPAYFLLTVKCFIILQKWRLWIYLINFQQTFSFYLLCCVLQQSGHWEAFRLVRSSFYLLSQCAHFWLSSKRIYIFKRVAGRETNLKHELSTIQEAQTVLFVLLASHL